MLTVFDRGYLDHLGRAITGDMPIANQGDRGTYFIDYEVFFGGYLTYNLSVSVSNGSPIVTLNGGNWSEFGISSGDSIVWDTVNDSQGVTAISGTSIISIVDGNEITLGADFSNAAMGVTGSFYVIKAPQAIHAYFNLIPKDNPSGIGSLIDGTTLNVINNSIGSMAVSDILPLILIGNKSGGGIISANIERLSDRKSGLAKAYRLKIDFIWHLFLSNFAPESFDDECTTPYVETSFLPLWNNPGVAISDNFKPLGDGNSGYRNENFNQNPNHFVVDSIKWMDDNSNILGGFDYSKKSFFEIEISSLTGFGSQFGLIFFNDIKDSDKYSASTSNNNGDFSHLQHTIFSNYNIPIGAMPSVYLSYLGKNSEGYTISVKGNVTGSILKIEGSIDPNASFIDTFSDAENIDKDFTLLARVESATFGASNYSDTVNLEAWKGEGKQYPKILGSFFERPGYLTHSDSTLSVESGKYPVIKEDDFAFYAHDVMDFNIPLTAINNRILIKKSGVEYELFSCSIPLPQNYVGGYLVCDESIKMPWFDYFPDVAQNINATAVTFSTQLYVKLPTLLNWRNFQQLPQLASVFGSNATKDWRWYQQNGWTITNRVEIESTDGVYVDDYTILVRDYDDNANIDWSWEFYKASDNTPLTSPINGELIHVVAKGDMPLNTTVSISGANVTVEGVNNPNRWLISSYFTHSGQTASPLQPISGQTKLKVTNIVAVNNKFELEFLIDTSKIDVSNGLKFTGRVYNSSTLLGYSERDVISFEVANLPPTILDDEYETPCCDCEPELKLASFTSDNVINNDITGVAHKKQTIGDVCVFKIYKGGILLANNGVDYTSGFPYDSKVSAFVYNWKSYLINHGQGCYKIVKEYTIAGLPFTEEVGKYNLLEYTTDNAQGTVRVLYQNNFQTLFDEEEINYTDSGFEDSYRFRGMFGNWQPNVFSSSNFSVKNENRTSSIKSKDTYILNHFHATECHIKRLHKIVMSASIWRMTDHNPSNTLQEKKVYECVLDNENKEQIEYNQGSRVTGIEIILSKRQQNSVSLFGGSIELPKGVTWQFPTIGGGGGCADSVISSSGVAVGNLPSSNPLNVTVHDNLGNPVLPISNSFGGGILDIQVGACPDSAISLDSTFKGNLPSGNALNVLLKDQFNAPIVPISSTFGSGILTAKVNVPVVISKAGIAYREPNMAHINNVSYATYDAGWRSQNNAYVNVQPAYPLYYQDLDYTSADPFNTLKFNNIFGNKYRFTDASGVNSGAVANTPFYDHLTGRIYFQSSLFTNFLTWTDLLILANDKKVGASTGFVGFAPSIGEFNSLITTKQNAIIINGTALNIDTNYRSWTCNIDQSNTANAIRMNGSQKPIESLAVSSTSRGSFFVKLLNPISNP